VGKRSLQKLLRSIYTMVIENGRGGIDYGDWKAIADGAGEGYLLGKAMECIKQRNLREAIAYLAFAILNEEVCTKPGGKAT